MSCDSRFSQKMALNDTSEISFKFKDVKSIESLALQLDNYRSFLFL